MIGDIECNSWHLGTFHIGIDKDRQPRDKTGLNHVAILSIGHRVSCIIGHSSTIWAECWEISHLSLQGILETCIQWSGRTDLLQKFYWRLLEWGIQQAPFCTSSRTQKPSGSVYCHSHDLVWFSVSGAVQKHWTLAHIPIPWQPIKVFSCQTDVVCCTSHRLYT